MDELRVKMNGPLIKECYMQKHNSRLKFTILKLTDLIVKYDVIIHRTSSRWPTPQNQVLTDTDTDEEFNIDEAAERVNTTFKNISVTTFVAEIGVPREIHRPVASHWQSLSHNDLSSTPRHEWGSNSQLNTHSL
jgi:hypothetical protein